MPFWRTQRTATFRLFYASDVHGSERAWRKFLAAPKVYGVQALVMGGDLTGKAIVPIVENGSSAYARLHGRMHELRTEGAIAEFEENVRVNGFYPYRCTEAEALRLEDEVALSTLFGRLIRETLERWVDLAEERLAASGVDLWIMPGNDDDFSVDDVLEGERVHNCDGRVVELGPYEMYSLGWSTPTPWQTPREASEDELWDRITDLVGEEVALSRGIFNFHVPPYGSELDLGPALSGDLTVVKEGGDVKRVPIGSRSVRKAIETYQPLLGLHGHVHESRGATRIGRTVCLNPGSRYGEGVVDGVIVTLEGDSVASHQFVTG